MSFHPDPPNPSNNQNYEVFHPLSSPGSENQTTIDSFLKPNQTNSPIVLSDDENQIELDTSLLDDNNFSKTKTKPVQIIDRRATQNDKRTSHETEKSKKKLSKVIPFDKPHKSSKNEDNDIISEQIKTSTDTQSFVSQNKSSKSFVPQQKSQISKTVSNPKKEIEHRKSAAAENLLKEFTKSGQLDKIIPESEVLPELKEIAHISGAEKYLQVPLWYRPFYFEADNFMEHAAEAELSHFPNPLIIPEIEYA